MIKTIKEKIYKLLRWSEKWTKTDMVYLAKGGFWLTLSQVVAMITAFLLSLAFANLLPKETYGVYKYVLSLTSILTVFTLNGMYNAVMQAVARGYDNTIPLGVKAKIKWGLLGSLVGLALAGYYYFQGNVTLALAFIIVAFFIPFMEGFVLFDALLGGKKLFAVSARYNITIQIIAISLMIAALFLTKNALFIILAYFVAYTLLRFISYKKVKKKYLTEEQSDRAAITYGKHLTLIDLISTVASNLDKILLFHYVGAASLAIYAFAQAPVNQISALLKTITYLSFPKFAQNDKDTIKKTLPPKLARFYLVIALGVIIYIILAPYFYKIFFPRYLEAVIYSQLFSLILLFFPQKLISTTLQALVQKRALYVINISNAIVRIILYLILLPLYGIYGAIIANIIPYLWNMLLLNYYFRKM